MIILNKGGNKMRLFGHKKNENKTDNNKKTYAFIGLGMMARFMQEEQLNELINALPSLIGRESGIPSENVVIVNGQNWCSEDEGMANSMNSDGSPVFPEAALKLCEKYLNEKDLHEHIVGDLQLLGILDKKGGLSFITSNELNNTDLESPAAQILVTAWLAFHKSVIK